MPGPKKYNDESRKRATRLAVDVRRDPVSSVGAIRRTAGQLGVHPEALRTWVKKAETDTGERPGTTVVQLPAYEPDSTRGEGLWCCSAR